VTVGDGQKFQIELGGHRSWRSREAPPYCWIERDCVPAPSDQLERTAAPTVERAREHLYQSTIWRSFAAPPTSVTAEFYLELLTVPDGHRTVTNPGRDLPNIGCRIAVPCGWRVTLKRRSEQKGYAVASPAWLSVLDRAWESVRTLPLSDHVRMTQDARRHRHHCA